MREMMHDGNGEEVGMDVLIDLEYSPIQEDGSAIELEFVEAVVKKAISMMDVPEISEVSVTFIDDDKMADLNEQYRSKSGPTDVLSFECDNLDDDFATDADEVYCLGDIVIAPDVAYKQSLEYGNTYKEELALLLVHGLLHLDGYDHIEDDEAQIMEDRQKEILSVLSSEISLA